MQRLTSVLHQFETYPQIVTGGVPVLNQVIGDYDLLNFNLLLINQTQPSLGTPCHTAPACAGVLLEGTALAGLLGESSGLAGPGRITAAYQYSPITAFVPYSFYYSCVAADANGVASIPVSCTITAAGLNSKGQQIYSQQFKYTASGAPVQPQVLGYFNQGWSSFPVQTLQLTVTNNVTTAALFDNFLATVYGPQNAAVTIDS